MYLKNTSGQFVTFCMISATDGSPVTGITPTCRRCIDGTFAAATGTITEDTGLGFYKMALSQADTNGNNIGYRFTGTGAIDVVVNIVTTSLNPYDAVRMGMTALPNAAADAAGGLPISDAGGLDLDTMNSNVAAVLADTGTDGVVVAAASKTGYSLTATTGLGNQTANITGNLSGSVGSVTGAVGSVTGAVGSVTGNVGGNVTGSIGSLAAQAKTDVNAELVDALATDTYAEPGQGTPGATITLAAKINYLYKAWRNKHTQTATEYDLYDDAGTTVDQKATVSDDATTFTRGEVATGP